MVIIQFGLISSLFLIGLLNALPTSKLSNETQSAYYDYDQFNLEEGEFPSDDYYYSHDHIFEKNDEDTALSDDYHMYMVDQTNTTIKTTTTNLLPTSQIVQEGLLYQRSTIIVDLSENFSAKNSYLLLSICVAAIGCVILTFIIGLIIRHRRMIKSSSTSSNQLTSRPKNIKKVPTIQEYQPIDQVYV